MSDSTKAQARLTDAHVLKTEPLSGDDAKWTKLTKEALYYVRVITYYWTGRVTYKDPLGRTRDYECAERATRPKNSLIDGVGVVAILQKPSGPEILLQKQFRPPVGKICIEIPAGLVDGGESDEEAAIRELKEETGYVGEIVRIASRVGEEERGTARGIMFNDPGFTNTNLTLVHVSVDLSKPENQPENLKTQLEENEFIETFSVPLKDFFTQCRKFEAEGCAIDARVGTLAEGYEMRARFGG